MNLSESAVVLRPRSVSQTIDLSLRVVFSLGLGLYARLAALTLLPALGLLLLLRYAAGLDAWLVWLAALVLAVVLEGPFTIAASRLMFREQLTGRAALRAFGGRALSFVGASLYKSLLLALASIPFFIPLLVVGPHAVFVPEASILERAGPTEAWARSKRLVMARSGGAMAALVSWLLIRVVCVLGAELLMQGIISDLFMLGAPLGRLSSDGVTPYALAGLLLSTPLVATARFLQYIDARTRGDGWDIQVRFMAIAAREGHKHSEAEA
ncbi:MAG: hypothetical protein JNL21_33510 [Myxococcales bacterium]|nr:hypothetical protein [Myxococcales bacterium]